MNIYVNGVNLHYDVTGSGRPLILLHGNGESCRIFDRITEELGKTHTVYAIDSRCHGKSEKHCSISYDLLAEDIIAFIRKMNLHRPVIYGFSDGGITGLLIAIREPGLLDSLIASGANLFPEGLEDRELRSMKRIHFFTRSRLYAMMISEPHIDPSELEKITIPVHLIAGEHDVIKREHTELIASHIKNCTLEIIRGADHDSYIIHNPELARILDKYLQSV